MRWLVLLSLLFLGCLGHGYKTVKSNLCPFDGYTYDNVSVEKRGKYIYVRASSSELDGVDEYLFVDDNGTLVLKSYCLEALPGSLKDELVDIALSNETVAKYANGIVTVRRILPQTAAKFYAPKELFSVTWHGNGVVSALIDLDKREVVRVYVRLPSGVPYETVPPSPFNIVQR